MQSSTYDLQTDKQTNKLHSHQMTPWKNVNVKMYFTHLKVWTEFFQAEPNLRSPKPLHCNEAQFQCLEGGQ